MRRGARLPVLTPKLTRREQEIVTLLATGMTHQEIGDAIGFAEHTMTNRVSKIYTRLGLRGSAALVAWALLTEQINANDVRDLWAERYPHLIRTETEMDTQDETLNRLLNETLTPTQLDFVWARLMFPTDAKAAEFAGIPKDTVYGWPKADRDNVHTAVRLLKARGVQTAAGILQRASVAAAVVKVAGLSERSKRLRQDAATEILDRTLGRPGQSIELSGKLQTENVTFDDSERVARLTALLDAARTRRDGSNSGDHQPVAPDSPPEPTASGG